MNITARLFSVVIAIAAMTGAANATVYTLSGQGIGPATATGTITTDGTLGVLSQSDIIGVDLTVADANGSVAADTYILVIGADLTATAKGLFFNYDGIDAAFVTYSTDFESGYCMATGPGTCAGVPDSEAILVNNKLYQGPSLAGLNVEFATAAVSEPATWAMLIMGLGAVGATLRRRKAALFVA
jgi:hypothetical protein